MSIFSKTTETYLKRYNITIHDYAFALMVCEDIDPADAYVMAYHPDNMSSSKIRIDARKKLTNKLIKLAIDDISNRKSQANAKIVRDMLKEKEEANPPTPDATESKYENIDFAVSELNVQNKEELLDEANKLLKKANNNDERLRILKFIGDINNAKKQEMEQEDDRVMYFVPLSCKSCSLYIEQKNKERVL